MEYTSTENPSTNLQGWKMQDLYRKLKYGNGESDLDTDITEKISLLIHGQHGIGIRMTNN